jgi:hypothetical protein
MTKTKNCKVFIHKMNKNWNNIKIGIRTNFGIRKIANNCNSHLLKIIKKDQKQVSFHLLLP